MVRNTQVFAAVNLNSMCPWSLWYEVGAPRDCCVRLLFKKKGKTASGEANEAEKTSKQTLCCDWVDV